MKSILVIIGNGFDLAYGLGTSYKDFFNSGFWPFPRNITDTSHKPISNLAQFLNDRMEDHWYGLESLLAKYGESIYQAKELNEVSSSRWNKKRIKADEESFYELRKGLKEFISDRERNVEKPDRTNPAATFLRQIVNNRNPIIYSFNYTDLSKFIEDCTGVSGMEYTHVHGSLKGPEEIVLGVQDNTRLIDGYDFLRKVSEPTYKSTNLFFDLMKANDVVFFGHSLGENDYHFFRSFFQKHSDESMEYSIDKPHITFFTANASSRIDILKNLREMNNGKNDQLFALNDLRFIRTIDQDFQAKDEFRKWRMELGGD